MKRTTFEKMIANGLGPKEITELLEPYISGPRREKIDTVLKARLRSLSIAMEAPSDIHNALAVVRTGEALGIDRMALITPEGKARRGWSTTKGALNWVELRYHEEIKVFAAQQKAQGIHLVGASLEGSMALEDVPLDRPLCLLFGNENRGLSVEAHDVCDYLYRIPMYGMSQSFNLSVSAALSLSHLAGKKRAMLKKNGDLSIEQLELERAWYYVRALSARLVQNLLKTAEK